MTTGEYVDGHEGSMTAALEREVQEHPLWYHTIDLGNGVVTPGWFDLRPIVASMPWPDVRGKRCLDVGTYDGYLAFELERRGAREVVATDIANHADWDWSRRERNAGVAYIESIAGEKGRGFDIAARAIGSSVVREFISIYELTPERLGTFDVVVCGSLLLHLRDPFRALDAVLSVCGETFLSAEEIDVPLTLLHPRRPAFRLNGADCQWLIPNAAGHRRMLEVAGFDVIESTRPYAIPLGAAHRDRSGRRRGRDAGLRLASRRRTSPGGVPTVAARTRVANRLA